MGERTTIAGRVIERTAVAICTVFIAAFLGAAGYAFVRLDRMAEDVAVIKDRQENIVDVNAKKIFDLQELVDAHKIRLASLELQLEEIGTEIEDFEYVQPVLPETNAPANVLQRAQKYEDFRQQMQQQIQEVRKK